MAGYLLLTSATAAAGYQAYQYAKIYKDELEKTIEQLKQQNKETNEKISLLARHVKDLEAQLSKIDTDFKENNSRTELELSDFEVNESLTNSTHTTPVEESPNVENKQNGTQQEEKEESKTETTKINNYIPNTLKTIKNVKKDAQDLEGPILGYTGSASDRVYKQYNETLIRFLIKLDLIDCKGDESLREERRDAVKFIQKLQQHLKTK